MKGIQKLTLLFVFSIVVLSGCEKNEMEQSDNLEQHGILGKWQLHSITINGITDMSIRFDSLEFTTDGNKGDLKGEFISISEGDETTGQFQLDPENNTIHFDYNSTQRSYEYNISESSMSFTYFEDNHEFIEDWTKEE